MNDAAADNGQDGGKKKKPKGKPLVWRESRPPDDSDEWMTTYADAVTLLLGFFVILFSVSEPNQSRFEDVRQGLMAEFRGEERESVLEQALSEMVSAAERAGTADVVSFTAERHGLVITIDSNALYNPGGADLLPTAVAILDPVVAQVTTPGFEAFSVEIEGHTDDTPIRTARFPSNWELSAQRATNVARYMIFKGVDRDRVRATALADTRPQVPNRDIMGRPIRDNQAQNRRIVIRVDR